MRVRRAAPADAAALAAFGERTFRDAFGALNRADDVDAYTAKTYGEAQQRREIEDPDAVTLVAEEEGAVIGFALLRRSASPFGDIELARFYVDRGWHGRGCAQTLLVEVEATARTLGGKAIWLSVWERNPRGIAFYAKSGFRDVGSQPFVVGSDLQTDRIMVLMLPRKTELKIEN